MKQTEILTHATHVNGWEPAVYMSCMSHNFRLFHVSNLSVRNFRIFLLMYTETLMVLDAVPAPRLQLASRMSAATGAVPVVNGDTLRRYRTVSRENEKTHGVVHTTKVGSCLIPQTTILHSTVYSCIIWTPFSLS